MIKNFCYILILLLVLLIYILINLINKENKENTENKEYFRSKLANCKKYPFLCSRNKNKISKSFSSLNLKKGFNISVVTPKLSKKASSFYNFFRR
jgi:hypothetical protein